MADDDTPLMSRRADDRSMVIVIERLDNLRKSHEETSATMSGIHRTLASMDKNLALSEQRAQNSDDRMDAIDDHLKETDSRVNAIEADKRSLAAVWTAIISAAGSVAAAIFAAFHSGAPK